LTSCQTIDEFSCKSKDIHHSDLVKYLCIKVTVPARSTSKEDVASGFIDCFQEKTTSTGN